MTRIKIAVIGVGMMGSHHVRDIVQLDNTILAAVCDTHQARVEKWSKEYAVPAFCDHRELLRSIDLDAILIATPPPRPNLPAPTA